MKWDYLNEQSYETGKTTSCLECEQDSERGGSRGLSCEAGWMGLTHSILDLTPLMELSFIWQASRCSEQLTDFEQNFTDKLMAHKWQAKSSIMDQKPHPYTGRKPRCHSKDFPLSCSLCFFCAPIGNSFFLSCSLLHRASKFEAARETAFLNVFKEFPWEAHWIYTQLPTPFMMHN